MNTTLQAMRLESLQYLARWARYAQMDWYDIPGKPGLGCYGTGYNSWGVQTNQKFISAMAVLAAYGKELSDPGIDLNQVRQQALAALRFALQSHQSGSGYCTDGTRWGHTWISAIGIERMLHGIHLLKPWFTSEDNDGLRAMLTSEADWLTDHYNRNGHEGVVAGQWHISRKNAPESNLWNGGLLYRTANLYPDHPRAQAWTERGHEFLLNGVSVPADAQDERIFAGKPLREWHRGANFFPHYALDHHGYLNVGYMATCTSHAAILHFDLRQSNLPACESVHLHQADLWRVIQAMIFDDGRLARIGGDTRQRYTYCQDYLLPSLFYAHDYLHDPQALQLAEKFFKTIDAETKYNGDGSFYGKRLAVLREQSPYYHSRLESDRACVLGMVIVYGNLLKDPQVKPVESNPKPMTVAWSEHEHGAVLHRSGTRLASFSWRAHGVSQGLCLPPWDGHLAEWENSLTGRIDFVHHPHSERPGARASRKLIEHHITEFPGGFITSGAVMEGVNLQLSEGWTGSDSAVHQQVFAALPDDHTVVGLQFCRVGPSRRYLRLVQGMTLQLPNDLFNQEHRHLLTEQGAMILRRDLKEDEIRSLQSRWFNVEGHLAAVGLYGADTFTLDRSITRRGGVHQSLHVETFAWYHKQQQSSVNPGQVLLDVGWLTASSVDGPATAQLARDNPAETVQRMEDARWLTVTAMDGRRYGVLANFSAQPWKTPFAKLSHWTSNSKVLGHDSAPDTLAPCQALIVALG